MQQPDQTLVHLTEDRRFRPCCFQGHTATTQQAASFIFGILCKVAKRLLLVSKRTGILLAYFIYCAGQYMPLHGGRVLTAYSTSTVSTVIYTIQAEIGKIHVNVCTNNNSRQLHTNQVHITQSQYHIHTKVTARRLK